MELTRRGKEENGNAGKKQKRREADEFDVLEALMD
jgi:hypothetical protein